MGSREPESNPSVSSMPASKRTSPTLSENFSSRGGNVRKIISNVLTSIASSSSPSPSTKQKTIPQIDKERTESTKHLMTRIRQRHSESSTKNYFYSDDGEEDNVTHVDTSSTISNSPNHSCHSCPSILSNICQSRSNDDETEGTMVVPNNNCTLPRLRRNSFIYSASLEISKERSVRDENWKDIKGWSIYFVEETNA